LRDLSSQISEGSRGEHELAKAKRRLELEKEELQLALESAESALEAEENKVLRGQVLTFYQIFIFVCFLGRNLTNPRRNREKNSRKRRRIRKYKKNTPTRNRLDSSNT